MIKSIGWGLLGGVLFIAEIVMLLFVMTFGMCLSFLFAGALGDKS